MTISQFIMENVRCFEGRHTLNIRPLTFLIGENSTGKSTVLECYQHLLEQISLANAPQNGVLDFATTKAGHECVLGFRVGAHKAGAEHIDMMFSFDDIYSRCPTIKETRLVFPDGNTFSFVDAEHVEVTHTDGRCFTVRQTALPHLCWRLLQEGDIQHALDLYIASLKQDAHPFYEYLRRYATRGQVPSAVHEPQVAYNMPRTPAYSIAVSANTPIATTGLECGPTMRAHLRKFGEESELFQDIQVAYNAAGCLQGQVTVRGAKRKIADTSRGIRELIPLLIKVLNIKPQQTMLMQQPETYLHPRAEATLTSLLIELAANKGARFLVETHSDFMLDRASIDIRKGKIKPEDVSLIYFEPVGSAVHTHNIQFDKLGELVAVPEGYREFYMKEGREFLGFIE